MKYKCMTQEEFNIRLTALCLEAKVKLMPQINIVAMPYEDKPNPDSSQSVAVPVTVEKTSAVSAGSTAGKIKSVETETYSVGGESPAMDAESKT